MNKSKKRIPILISLIVLALVVWSMALAGLAKNSLSGVRSLKKGNSQNEQNQIEEPMHSDLSQSSDSTNPSGQQKELDVSGNWDMSFCRYYSTEYEGAWENLGTEEVFLQMEIYPGKQFECDIMPVEAYINGEQYYDYLAVYPQLYTGEIKGNTLMLYLDLDDFYLDYNSDVTDTIEPQYIEIPLTLQNGRLCGSYELTWVANIEGYYLQSRVVIEVAKR